MGYYYAIDSYVEFPCTLSDRCLKARFKRFSLEQEANSKYWDLYLDPKYYRFYKVNGFFACMDLEEAYAKHRNADEQLAEFISQVIDPGGRCYFEVSGEDGDKWGYAIERGKVHYLAYKGPYVEAEDDLVPLSRWLSGDERIEGKRFFAIYSKHGFFHGVYEGETWEEALKAMYDDAGCDLKEEDPCDARWSVKDAEEILSKTLEWHQVVETDIPSLIRSWAGCRTVKVAIRSDVNATNIWIEDPCEGHWLDRKEKASLLTWLERL